MAYKFNPFTGTLDDVGSAGGAGAVAGSEGQVQFNDGGQLGADTGLAFDKTTNELTVGVDNADPGTVTVKGDLNLDSGATYSTTVQSVTPTANRTISFPDQTGTVALVAGATGAIQYNEGGAQTGTADFAVDPDWNNASTTFTGLKLNVTNTASAADSKLVDVQEGGTTVLELSKSKLQFTGTNAVVQGVGATAYNLYIGFDLQFKFLNQRFSLDDASQIDWSSTSTAGDTPDIGFARDQAGVVAITDGSTGTGYLKQTPVTVASLPSAATVGAGTLGFVSDATATTFASVVAGSGSNNVPVYSDGTDWRIG